MKQRYTTGTSNFWMAACGLAVLVSMDAQAQSEQASESMVLEEVIVTAQRRDENLQETALSATVLLGDLLNAKGIDDLVGVQYISPSITVSDFGSANVFNIRGIGRSKVDIEIPSGVVIYQDGVPSLAGYIQNEPYYDIASIEVLRGPQGTFVGKSASGGAIFTRTRDPELGDFGGYLEGGFGEHNLWEAQGAFNMPASDTLAFRFAFNYRSRDDYYDRIYGPYTGDPGTQDLQSARLGMLWQPNDQLSVVAKVYYADLDFGGNVTSSYGDPLYDVHQDAPFDYTDKSTRATLNIDYLFDSGITFSSLTGYQKADTVNNLDLNGSIQNPRYWFLSKGDIDLLSQEFNLISDEDQRLRWVVGAFLQNQKVDIPGPEENGFGFIGGDPFGIGQLPMEYMWLASPWIKDEDDWALFAHTSYDISDTLEIEAGARYSDYEFYQQTNFVYGFGDAPPVLPFPPGKPAGPDRQDFAETSTDWKLALNWKPDDDNFFYGLISRGHTTGSVNIFPPWQPYPEMEVLNYEAGWKASFAERRFQTQLSTYYTNISDYQAAFTDLDIPDSAGQVQGATSDSTIYGIEFTGQASFDAWMLEFGASWNESELGDFNNVVHPLTLETVDLTGASFPFAPQYTFNIGVAYNFELDNGSKLTPRIDFAWIDDSYGELFQEPEFLLESRSLTNARIRWDSASLKWYAELWSTNLFDEKYVAAIQNTGSLYYAGARRQSGIRVGYNF
jgi:iron complex outermembrane receptor protein